MKILQVGLSYHIYAQGAICEQVHKELLAQGHQSKVFFSDEPQWAQEGAEVFETKAQNVYKRVCRRYFGKQQRFARPQTRRLIKMIKRYQPDLIQFHNIHHLTVDYPYLFRFLEHFGAKLVFTVHDMWNMTGGCYHFTNIGCNGFLSGCQTCPKKQNELDCAPAETARHFATKAAFYEKTNPGFVYVSNWLAGECRNSYLKQYTDCVIPNGLDIELFQPSERNYFCEKIPADCSVVLGVATFWGSDKGFEQFVTLAKQLGEGYCVVLIGVAPTVDLADLPENLILWGKVSGKEELCRAYSSADVFVHLSKEETFGLVLAEAACCGTVPVGYRSTGVAEVLDMAHGLCAQRDDVDAICAHVKEICTAHRRIEGEVLEQVRSVFSQEKMVSSYLSFYRQMLSEKEEL